MLQKLEIDHSSCLSSLVNQTAPSAALDVLHHQKAEGGSGHSGTVFVARWNVWSHDISHLEFNFVPQICTDYQSETMVDQRLLKNTKALGSKTVAEGLFVACQLACKYIVDGQVRSSLVSQSQKCSTRH